MIQHIHLEMYLQIDTLSNNMADTDEDRYETISIESKVREGVFHKVIKDFLRSSQTYFCTNTCPYMVKIFNDTSTSDNWRFGTLRLDTKQDGKR